MTPLRTTRPVLFRDPLAVLAVGVAGLLALGLFGCGPVPPPPPDDPAGTVGSNDPAWLTSRERLPSPDADRIEYDAERRTLHFYELPGRDRWLVQLPNEETGKPVGPQHKLPEGVDLKNTLVYYARPGVKVSSTITVAAIEAGRRTLTSLALHR